MNTALMPMPRLQFSDVNGVPLAGGFIFTYASGTTTPLATYQDSLGAAANLNPVVLDAGGFAAIWLAAATYKIVVQDFNGVQQWTADNVSAVSLTELQGVSSFAALTVTGGLTVGGDETLAGTLTAATVNVTGSLSVAGNLSAATAGITGNATVGGALSAASAAIGGNEAVAGTLTVTGATALSTLSVNGVDISALITSLIPVISAVSGALIVTNVASVGNWVVFTFGATVGTRIRIALGSGAGIATGGVIPLPAGGFTTSQLVAGAWVDSVTATAGNQFSRFAVSVTAGTITVSAGDATGHNFTPTAAWLGCAWQTAY